MFETTARRLLSVLVVGLVMLSAFVVLGTSVRGASASLAPTSGTVEQPFAAESPVTDAMQSEARDNLWSLKLDASLREVAAKGTKDLRDIIVYTENMPELAPLLDKYGVRELPEAIRGETVRDVTRTTRAVGDGIISTRVTVPTYAIAEIAKLPGVLGIEQAPVPRTADFTNIDLTEARERFRAFREEAAASETPLPTDWGIVRAHHVVDDSGNYPMDYDGSGVNVAVQDWGVDFAHPNLAGQYATVTDSLSPYYQFPIMHSQMSLWNNLELFTATSDFDRLPYPIFFSFGTASWFSDTSYQATADAAGTLTYATGVTYGFFQQTKRVAPQWTSCPSAGSLISRTYYVGDAADPLMVPSASGIYHLGVNKDYYLEGIWCERVGILVADTTTAGVYDTVIVDMNDNDDFTDDTWLTITGNPVAAWDADGDGVSDLSGGILYFVGNQLTSVTDEPVIAAATGTETGAALANGWIETDVEGFNLFTATMALDGMYWPSSGEDIWESVIDDTTGLGDETGTMSQLTAGFNLMTGAAVDTLTLLADYDLDLVYDIYNSSGSLVEDTDYSIDLDTGEITWLTDFPDGDFVEIIYEFLTWTLDYNTGDITFDAPPIAGAAVTATYNSGLPVPYADITAARQGWDLFVPGPGDLVAFHGAFADGQEHGTWVSTNLAGVPFGNLFGIFDIYGTAPGAKIIGVDLPTSFDVAELFHFSSVGYDGIAGTGDEANIVTNSWGYTSPQETGFTFIERYLYDLTTNVVPDLTILFAAGNNGPGFSTSTPPNTAPGVITVGAGTLMNYRWLLGSDLGEGWYDWPFLGEGAFGVGPYGDMVDFSSKGPSLIGAPEPDVIAAGAFGFGGRPLNSACIDFYGADVSNCTGLDSFDLWSGTSMSTPVAAGIVALIYEAYGDTAGAWPTSDVARGILMSSADDHGFDPLQQGAGWVNGTAAVELATSTAGFRVSPTSLTPGTYGGVHRPAFVNFMRPGDTYMETLTVHNTASAATFSIGDAYYTRVGPNYEFDWDFTNPVAELRILKPDGLYAADGSTVIDLEDFTARWNGATFIRVTIERDPAATAASPATGFEMFDWYDLNGNGTFDPVAPASPLNIGLFERNRYSFWGFEGDRWSNAGDVYDPANRVHDGLVLRIRDFNGVAGLIHVTVEFYGKANWGWANAELATSLNVGADASGTFDVTFSVPAGTQAGMYEGAVWVETGGHTVIVPVVITVPAASGQPVHLGGGTPATTLYDNNGVLQGQGPGNWRQIGDSRLFWYDFTALAAANRRLIYNLLLNSAPSEGEITVYQLVPDASWTDDAIYGPGTMVEIATTKEVAGASDTLYLNKEFLHSDVLSGVFAVQVKAMRSVASDEPFSLDIGIMETTPDEARISTNQLAGSVPVSVTSSVSLQDGLDAAVTEQIVELTEDLAVDSYPYPGGSFIQYLFDAPNTYETVIPAGTIAATYSAFFHSGASDVDFGLFYDGDCDGAYTVADDVIGSAMGTAANPESATLSFPDPGCYWVHAAGFDVVATGGLFDLTLSINKIGVSAFALTNGPTATVPAYTAAAFDLAWDLPGSTPTGVQTGFLFVSPGFAPFALTQQVMIVFNYDLNPPTFSAHLPAPGAVTSDSTPGIFVQINDGDAGSLARRGEIDQTLIRVWLDGLDITSIASINVPHSTNTGYPTGTVLFTPGQPLSDGPHTMIVQAGDFAGNLATNSWTFTVDTTAPSLDILAPVSGMVTSATSVTVMGRTAVGASVTVAGQAVFVDGAGQFSSSVTLSEGANTIDISATDAIGNTATTSVVVTRDTTAPALSLLRSSAGVLTNDGLTVVSGVVSEPAASVSVAGIPAMVHADGSFAVPVSLVEGTNAIAIVATDAAGNSATSTLSVTRDSTAPALTMADLPSETSSATITVSGTVESGISFVTVNGQPVAVTGGTYSTPVALSFGSNVIFVEATDGAGNRAVMSAAVSYVPTGVTTAGIGLILLPVLTIIALLVGLAIGGMRGRGGGERGERLEDKEAMPPAEEELPPEGGEL